MRAIVTGGAGFIGSHLVDRLVDDGHAVCVVDDLSTGSESNVSPRAEFHCVNICNGTSLRDVFEAWRPEVVFHLAAQMDVRRSTREPDFDARVNVLGGLNVLRSAIAVGAERIVYASSGGAVYGDAERLPASEGASTRPVSEYGVSKLAFEHYLGLYGSRGEIEYVTLRYPNVYGPRQRPDGKAGVVAIFAARMLRRESIKIFGDGKQSRDYLYVSDVVEANVRAASGVSHVVANLGWGCEVSDLELFREVATATNYVGTPVYAPARRGDVLRSCLDTRLALRTWGWYPRVPLREGIRRVVEHLNEAISMLEHTSSTASA